MKKTRHARSTKSRPRRRRRLLPAPDRNRQAIKANERGGFTIAVRLEDLYYVLYFAVDEALRGKGYGSQILGQLQAEYGTLGLNIEPLDPTAENYAQRQKRFAFYQKNGFLDTEHFVWEVGGKFRVLSTDKKLPMSQVKKVFRKLTMGLLNVKTQ